MKSRTSAIHGTAPFSRGRHEYHRRICKDARRADIEEAFVNSSALRALQSNTGSAATRSTSCARVPALWGQRRRITL
jgi:hypothetical protein